MQENKPVFLMQENKPVFFMQENIFRPIVSKVYILSNRL